MCLDENPLWTVNEFLWFSFGTSALFPLSIYSKQIMFLWGIMPSIHENNIYQY